jgi:hypothetical protein
MKEGSAVLLNTMCTSSRSSVCAAAANGEPRRSAMASTMTPVQSAGPALPPITSGMTCSQQPASPCRPEGANKEAGRQAVWQSCSQ